MQPSDVRGGELNLLMVSGDASIAEGRKGPFYYTLEGFSRWWLRVDVVVPRPASVANVRLFGNVFLHPSPVTKALQWCHIFECGRALHAERRYALMTSHDYGWHYNGVGTWLLHRATGTPYVSEIHHVTGHPRAANFKEWLQGRATRFYVRTVRRQVAGFRVTNATELPALLGRLGVPPDKIHVLHALYVDHEVFRPRQLPKKYDVMFCGRADSNKGGDILLRAVAQLAKSRPSLSVLMRTAGHEEGKWRRLAHRLGIASRLTWRTWVESPEDLASLYCMSRVLTCTSLSEGGPRVTVEAMACSVPVISTRVGIMPELIEHGKSGLLVDWTPRSVAAAIEHILDDHAAAAVIGAAGREGVGRFERAALIDACASTYHRLANMSAEHSATV